jgi:hypothetical protein
MDVFLGITECYGTVTLFLMRNTHRHVTRVALLFSPIPPAKLRMSLPSPITKSTWLENCFSLVTFTK